MKTFKKILKIFLLLKFIITAIESDPCKFKPDGCETCEMEYKNVTLTCTIENKTDTQLLEKIDLKTQQFQPGGFFYRKIIILNKNFRLLSNILFKLIDIDKLNLAFNEIEYIFNNTFSMIKSLGSINLSYNKLKSIDGLIISLNVNPYLQFSSLVDIDFSSNKIKLNEGFFYSNIFYSMDLSYNRIINCIGINNNNLELRRLLLDQNLISSIEDFFFSRMAKLDYLSLSRNQLVKINKNLFFGLQNLTTLILSRNLINSIKPGSFQYLESLKSLRLENNNIQNIESFTFYGLAQLESLSLEFNYLEIINEYTFYDLENLKEIFLNSNKIRLLETTSFFNLKNLKIIYLDENHIDLSVGFFENLVNIRTLSFQNNQIKELNNVNFGKNLKSLDLRSNLLRSIDSAFNSLKLEYIDL